MSPERPQIRNVREGRDDPSKTLGLEAPVDRALVLAREIESLLATATVTLSPQQAYAVRLAQAVSATLIDQLAELARRGAA